MAWRRQQHVGAVKDILDVALVVLDKECVRVDDLAALRVPRDGVGHRTVRDLGGERVDLLVAVKAGIALAAREGGTLRRQRDDVGRVVLLDRGVRHRARGLRAVRRHVVERHRARRQRPHRHRQRNRHCRLVRHVEERVELILRVQCGRQGLGMVVTELALYAKHVVVVLDGARRRHEGVHRPTKEVARHVDVEKRGQRCRENCLQTAAQSRVCPRPTPATPRSTVSSGPSSTARPSVPLRTAGDDAVAKGGNQMLWDSDCVTISHSPRGRRTADSNRDNRAMRACIALYV
jgi:hypothetical protein